MRSSRAAPGRQNDPLSLQQIVEAGLGLGHAIVDDQGSAHDVEDFWSVRVIVAYSRPQVFFHAGQITTMNLEQCSLDLDPLGFFAQRALAEIEILLRFRQFFLSACRACRPKQ